MTHFISMAFDQSVRETSPEGHLRIHRCILSAATVSPYLGKEIVDGARLGFRPDVIYQLYRDPQALAKAADTMNGKPILMQHRAVSSTDHPAEITVGVSTSLATVGEKMVEDIKASIEDKAAWKPNAPATVKRKGFDAPLQHTKHMRDSVRSEIE